MFSISRARAGAKPEERMNVTHAPYLKAMGSDRLVPLYDLAVRLAMREQQIRRRVLDRVALGPGQRLLDLGCGTGTLAILAQRRHPRATVVGLDGDPVILGIARRKARRARVVVQFDEGMAAALPYADGSFDAVTSTLMLHHLTHDHQLRALAEARRVLRPGGRLVVADFAPPPNRRMAVVRRAGRLLTRLHGGRRRHGGPAPGRLEQRLTALGWQGVSPPEYHMTLVGALALVTATRPLGKRVEHPGTAGAVERA